MHEKVWLHKPQWQSDVEVVNNSTRKYALDEEAHVRPQPTKRGSPDAYFVALIVLIY